jgi:hypothetical protein
LSSGELVGSVVDAIREPDCFERAGRPLPPFGPRHPGKEHRQLDVALRGEARQEVEELKDEADLRLTQAGALGIRQGPDVDFPDPDGPITAR